MKIRRQRFAFWVVFSAALWLAAWAYHRTKLDEVQRQYEYATTLNLLAAYRGHAKISGRLSAGDYSDAKCMADIRASAEYDELRKCLASERCRSIIIDDVAADSPELLSRREIEFSYYGNGRPCKNMESMSK